MSEKQMAEQNLATIRGLVEHAEIYRGVLARAAFIGGVLSILTAGAIYVNDEVTRFLDRTVRPREFAFAWLDVLFVTVIVAAWLMNRATRGNGDGHARMNLVLRIVAPFVLIPAAFTSWFFATGYLGAAELDLVTVWIVFYGLALLSTAFFAPRSIALLGWAFLLTGLSVPVIAGKIDEWVDSVPTVLMGVSFGVYHIIFAAFNWRASRVSKAG
jgi:hypothetical protein